MGRRRYLITIWYSTKINAIMVDRRQLAVGTQNSGNYGDLLLREGLRGSFIFVGQSAEDRFSAYPALRFKIDDGGRRAWR